MPGSFLAGTKGRCTIPTSLDFHGEANSASSILYVCHFEWKPDLTLLIERWSTFTYISGIRQWKTSSNGSWREFTTFTAKILSSFTPMLSKRQSFVKAWRLTQKWRMSPFILRTKSVERLPPLWVNPPARNSVQFLGILWWCLPVSLRKSWNSSSLWNTEFSSRLASNSKYHQRRKVLKLISNPKTWHDLPNWAGESKNLGCE